MSLLEARLIKRYKRFLADVELLDGTYLTVHCPNTGAMTGCAEPGSRVWLSKSDNPKRKYAYTWELVETVNGLARIHSAKANELVKEAIQSTLISELQGYSDIRSEVKYGVEKSRIDLLLQGRADGVDCYVEVKSVTLYGEQGRGYFPDAKSSRGTKHLRELVAMTEQGFRAVLCYCVQHTGIDCVSPADHIDAVYGETLRWAIERGVEVIAYGVVISPEALSASVVLHKPVAVDVS